MDGLDYDLLATKLWRLSDMSRKPTYRLKILNKKEDTRCSDAGSAWVNKDGSISLVINPGISLKENKDYVYTLFIQDNI